MRRNPKVGFALGLGLLGGLAGTATDASALDYRRPCRQCDTAGTTRIYRTIHPLLEVTRYHDRAVYHHVTRLHFVVDVTRIQPIVHVHDVTRVHHFTIMHDAYAYQVQAPAPLPLVEPTPVYASGCGCVD